MVIPLGMYILPSKLNSWKHKCNKSESYITEMDQSKFLSDRTISLLTLKPGNMKMIEILQYAAKISV